jgi:hypothetical protein
MKIRRLIVCLLFMGVLLSLIGNCATDKTAYVPIADEEIYGTWINEEEAPQKWILYANGTYEYYIYASDTSPYEGGTFQLYKKWKDDQGNIWYYDYVIPYEHRAGGTRNVQELDRIYRNGKEWVWEYDSEIVGAFDPGTFLAKIDPESARYHVYYRSTE